MSGKKVFLKKVFLLPADSHSKNLFSIQKDFPGVFLLKSFQNTVFSEQILGIPLEKSFPLEKDFSASFPEIP